MKPGGSCTSTLTVPASSRSLGTRTSSRVKPPAGAVSGWTVTWACAAAGRAAARRPRPRRIGSAHGGFLLHSIGTVNVGRSSSKSEIRATSSSRQSPGGARAAAPTT